MFFIDRSVQLKIFENLYRHNIYILFEAVNRRISSPTILCSKTPVFRSVQFID